jgi:hypothetical protein
MGIYRCNYVSQASLGNLLNSISLYIIRRRSYYYLNEYIILYVFHAPRYNSPYIIKLIQILG